LKRKTGEGISGKGMVLRRNIINGGNGRLVRRGGTKVIKKGKGKTEVNYRKYHRERGI